MKNKLHIVSEPTYSKKVRDKICIVYGCNKDAGNKGKFKHCYKHHRENQKYNNPLRYYYDILRQNAKYRKKEFTITIEYFKEFCDKHNYLELKGRGANNLSIDRIRQSDGYIEGNLQVLTGSQNSRKYWIDLKIRFGYYPTDEELEEMFGGEVSNAELQNLVVEMNNNEEGAEDCPF